MFKKKHILALALTLPLRYSCRYSKYLSQHIIDIVNSKPDYAGCLPHFQKIIQKHHHNEAVISKKLNMVFNVYCLQPPLSDYKQKLICYIESGQIQHQSQLDRVLAWLTKNIKYDRFANIDEIVNQQGAQSTDEFQKQINKIENGQYSEKSVSETCKLFRNKFIAVDSKLIYSKVKSAFQKILKKSCQTKKDNSTSVKYFWDKLHNIRPRLLPEECNHPQIYIQHQQITKGQLRFRFPPQPNGYLHIGHIKSMRINFQTAKKFNGSCYLRYDDTNPETQSHQYIDNILENVKWLGYKPDKITFASDYFAQMIQLAVKLIKDGNAYVCDSPAAEIQNQRINRIPNKYRNRSIEESLKYFPNLGEGQTLRLKLAHDASNPTLRDPIIYRKKNMEHPRTGSKYSIYPMYDFAHCICDSLEHIDYSLCTLQFEVRRQLYYKILDLLQLYKPNVWEYSRVNVQSALISKRKIKSLIDKGVINDWSDPRLLTIGGMINRGYTPTMLINFIDRVNSSRAGNENVVQFSLLERQMRKQLFKKAQKYMMVLDPIEVQIQNLEQQQKKQIKLFTEDQKKQTRNLTLTKKIFVQASQHFKEGDYIILKYFGVFMVKQQKPNLIFKREQISVEKLKQSGEKFKILHWISDKDSILYEVTCFQKLLDKENNPIEGSEQIFTKSLIPKQILQQNNNSTDKYWQMQRLGYFKFMSNKKFIRCVTL